DFTLSVDRLDPIEEASKVALEFHQILGTAHDVVVRAFGRHRPNSDMVAEHGVNPIVRNGCTERQLKRDSYAWRSGILAYAECDCWLVGLPPPCRRLAVSLVHRYRDNVSKELAEFDQKRLRRQRKDAELPDLFLLDPFLHLAGEDT